MEAPSIHASPATLEQNLADLVIQIHTVRGQRWLAKSGVSHGKFMAEQREQLRAIAREMRVVTAELFDLWPFMQTSAELRARHELLMRTALRWMATCDVDMAMPLLRAYRTMPHRLRDLGRAYASFSRGRLSYFGDDGVRSPQA